MSVTPTQIQALGDTLRSRRTALAAELNGDAARTRAETFGALAGEAPDDADASVAALLADSGQAELSRDLGELREVDAALARIANGTYGTCTDCAVSIELARLLANPAAVRCVSCQSRHEKTHAGGRGSSL